MKGFETGNKELTKQVLKRKIVTDRIDRGQTEVGRCCCEDAEAKAVFTSSTYRNRSSLTESVKAKLKSIELSTEIRTERRKLFSLPRPEGTAQSPGGIQ
jgi:hypothetical protein